MKTMMRLLVVFAVLASVSGCVAGFSGNKVGYDALALPPPAEKRGVYVDLVSESVLNGLRTSNVLAIENHRSFVRGALERTGAFGRVTFDGFEQNANDLKIQVVITCNQESSLVGILTLLSVGVIPSSYRKEYYVSMRVKDSSGSSIEVARNDDYVTEWVGWAVIPWSSNTPAKAEKETLERQLSAAVKRLLLSGIMTESSR